MKRIADHNPVVEALGRPLRLGVTGGGAGSFIGPIHRSAATLDRRFEVVAGVLSSDRQRSMAQGVEIGLDRQRAYGSVDEMIEHEAALGSSGIDAVAVMTPNDRHCPDSSAALGAGLHVICDKPMANSVAEARALNVLVSQTGKVFCLTHNYSAYPMVRQARAMVEAGLLGDLRIVQVEYFQGGMALPVEHGALTPKLRWKFDRSRSGPSLVLGDIGTHAHHLACFVCCDQVAAVAADIGALVPTRQFDDYAGMLWRFRHGARGSCVVTQAAAGAENNLILRVYGEKGMLEWQHLTPNYLRHAPLGEAVRTLGRGDANLAPEAERACRIARGHPEGFRESFATLYADFAEAIVAQMTGIPADPYACWFPSAADGLHGALFIEAALRSSNQGGAWVHCDAS